VCVGEQNFFSGLRTLVLSVQGVATQRVAPLTGARKMNRYKFIPAIVAALLLTTVVGCAETSTHESTGQYVDDAALTTKVKAAILDEPTLKVSEINVETYQGKVQLSGFVASQDDINKAVDVARNVAGVKEVNNDIRLK